jgi:CcdB protein
VGQYDIHRNPGRKTARTHPFLMVVQSDRWAGLDTRLVAPLVLRSTVPADEIAQSYIVVREECLNRRRTAGFATAPSVRFCRLPAALG